jgi:hypothetical protein
MRRAAMSEIYEIKIRGHVDPSWMEWFGNLAVSYDEEDNAVLVGPIPDQPALHGLLDRIRDLNLTLLSVVQITSEPSAHKTREDETK